MINSDKPKFDVPLLDSLNLPDDIKNLNDEEVHHLSAEIRAKIIEVVSSTGGHLASSLGVIDLTLAMMRTFDFSKDKLVWDVGHQAYAYKLLTGRTKRFNTLRQLNGISGFPKRTESEYDHFGVGHASTSISAATGFVAAREMAGDDNKVVAVIGDGALTGGMVYEAMNHAGAIGKPMIVILNDNQMSISKNVGALSLFLSSKLSSAWFRRVKREIDSFLNSVPGVGNEMALLARRSKQSFISFFTPGILFEALQFSYIGPVNGHDYKSIEKALAVAVDKGKPVVVHVLTQKGKGYEPAECNPNGYHGIGKFDPSTGNSCAPVVSEKKLSYTDIFSDTMLYLGRKNPKVVGITAAMCDGTGLKTFASEFPARFYDIGICEEHGVTFAASMSAEKFRPVVSIYSTFLQRSYDQIVHDVALQNLPVTFAIDRAGLVGEDGPTHHGVFDISYLRHIPNLQILAPRSQKKLQQALITSIDGESPIAIRYPRGNCEILDGVDLETTNLDDLKLPVGLGELVLDGNDLLVIPVGSSFYATQQAITKVRDEGKGTPALFDPIWVKPLPSEQLCDLVKKFKKLLIIEENSLQGGFGSAVLELLADKGLLSGINVTRVGIPDSFVEQGTAQELRKIVGLDSASIYSSILTALEN